jgi:hypothetical protein
MHQYAVGSADGRLRPGGVVPHQEFTFDLHAEVPVRQPYQLGGPSRRPRRRRGLPSGWIWKAVMIAMVLFALVRAWQMWEQPWIFGHPNIQKDD